MRIGPINWLMATTASTSTDACSPSSPNVRCMISASANANPAWGNNPAHTQRPTAGSAPDRLAAMRPPPQRPTARTTATMVAGRATPHSAFRSSVAPATAKNTRKTGREVLSRSWISVGASTLVWFSWNWPAASFMIRGWWCAGAPASASTTHTISTNMPTPRSTLLMYSASTPPTATPTTSDPINSHASMPAAAMGLASPPISAWLIAAATAYSTMTMRSAMTTRPSVVLLTGPSASVSASSAITTAGDCEASVTPITVANAAPASGSRASSHGSRGRRK